MIEKKVENDTVSDILRLKTAIYSTAQMDNFYKALAGALVKPSGVMNYIQHLFISEHCREDNAVLDICCGRALMVPILKRYAPHISHYVGIDISSVNLEETRKTILLGNGNDPPFSCNFIQGDVTKLPISSNVRFDVVVYTSSLEHLDRESGIVSIHQVSRALSDDGTLYLSTPRTPARIPQKLQYKVHVHEWDCEELEQVLNEAGLTVIEYIGLLPPPDKELHPAIISRFGTLGVAWFQEMRRMVPNAFLDPVIAACFPNVAKELMYICKRR